MATLRTYVVHGEYRDSGAYVEKTTEAISAKQAYEILESQYPDIRFISARKKGCNCGK